MEARRKISMILYEDDIITGVARGPHYERAIGELEEEGYVHVTEEEVKEATDALIDLSSGSEPGLGQIVQ